MKEERSRHPAGESAGRATPTPRTARGRPRWGAGAALAVAVLPTALLMVGPQLFVVVAMALGTGVALLFLRSSYALVFLGYPLLFGLVSAAIGLLEIHHAIGGYFWLSAAAGALGVGLIACGFALALRRTPRSNEEGAAATGEADESFE